MLVLSDVAAFFDNASYLYIIVLGMLSSPNVSVLKAK